MSHFRTILTAFIALCVGFIAIKADAFVELQKARLGAQLAETQAKEQAQHAEAAQFQAVILSQQMLATTIETLQARQRTFELQIKTLEREERLSQHRNNLKDRFIEHYMKGILR